MRTNRYLLLFPALIAALMLTANSLSAQCNRLGKVASIEPGCGVKIIDQNNGETILAVSGIDNLSVGNLIHFAGTPTDLLPGCSMSASIPVLALTCVENTLPCETDFVFYHEGNNPLRVLFSAGVQDALAENFHWNFGDGSEDNGATRMHTFPTAGSYTVCLTKTDIFGCSVQKCQTVSVSSLAPDHCGYDIQATTIGTMLYAKISATDPNAPDLQFVKWVNPETGQSFSGSTEFNIPLPDYGSYYVCAIYEAGTAAAGNLCGATLCKQVETQATGCILDPLVNAWGVCQTLAAPVCGCNGVTYANECDAMNAGLSSWHSGACGNSANNLKAQLEVMSVTGNPDQGFYVQFKNNSVGDYTTVQLDFGDGSTIFETSNWLTYSHHYINGGVYRANLTAWNKFTGTVSSQTYLVFTDSYNLNFGSLPPSTDYVYPGDANGDHKANVYDLLSVGVGYSNDGPPRPNASNAWAPQFAPNWQSAVEGVVNYKHLDCDGDGSITEFDADLIPPHYAAIDTTPVEPVTNLPAVWLKYSQDTIVVDANVPTTLEIEADVMVGSQQHPALNLYGIAFALKYPEYVEHDPAADYEDNSFFGFTNHILWMPKDIYNRRQFDMGFVRKNGQESSGFGKIATVTFRSDFIIIVDIVDRVDTKVIPFVVPVTGIHGINANGEPMQFSVPATQDTIWIKLEGTVGTKDRPLDQLVSLTPNPASGITDINTGSLDVVRIEALNMLGQNVMNITPSGNRVSKFNVQDWEEGVYTLRIYTEQGLAEKRLVVQHSGQ